MRRLDYPDRDAWCAALVAELLEVLGRAIEARSQATMVVSGGSTPAPVYEALAGAPLDWARITLVLADERWVSIDDPASNEGMLRRIFAHTQGPAIIGLKTPDADPGAACACVEARLTELARPFDVVLLGMGEDGHTASLFPGTVQTMAALAADCRHFCTANLAPAAPRQRISLTAAALLDSRRILLLLTGQTKAAVLARAMQPGSPAEYPVRCVLQQERVPVDVYWSAQ